MAKLFIEDTEITISEKTVVEDGKHEITDKSYTLEVVERTTYKSTLFSYEDLSVLISKQKRFNEKYYRIVLFSDIKGVAWPLVVLSSDLKTKVKRLNEEMFLVTGESERADLQSQISFCKLKPSGKVEEITINFTTLKDIQFIDNKGILVNFEEKDDLNDDVLHVLAMYNVEGKLLKTFYEFYNKDKEKYTYEIKDNNLRIIKLSEDAKTE